MSDFEWDHAKALINLQKHSIAFEDAARALTAPNLTAKAPFDDEERFASICNCNGRLIVVVWTQRDSAKRLISARRARIYERQQYHQAFGDGAKAR